MWPRTLPDVHIHLLTKMDFSVSFWEAGRTYYWLVPSPFSDAQGTFLCMCSLGGLLDPRNEKYVASISLLPKQDSAPLCSLSWSICPQETESSCSAWGPAISCLSDASVKTQSMQFVELPCWWTRGDVGRMVLWERPWTLQDLFQIPCHVHLFHLAVPESYPL